MQFINSSAQKDLQIKSQLQFENLNEGEFAKLRLKLMSSVNLEQVQLLIAPNPAFTMSENITFLKDLKAFDERIIDTVIFLNKSQNFDLCFGEFTIMVSFTNKLSIIRVIRLSIDIPLKNVLRNDNPQKDGMFKITMSIINPIGLTAIFSGT